MLPSGFLVWDFRRKLPLRLYGCSLAGVLRDGFEAALLYLIPDLQRNGALTNRLPHDMQSVPNEKGIFPTMLVMQFNSQFEIEFLSVDEQNFKILTQRGQMQRLKGLALSALSSYDLHVIEVLPLSHTFNAVFKVVNRPRTQSDPTRFVLRICQPSQHTDIELFSELHWLVALTEETELRVPQPVRNSMGQLFTMATARGVPEARQCVLFKWVDGNLYRKATVSKLASIGQVMAKLHTNATEAKFPPIFVRKRIDLENLLASALGYNPEYARANISKDVQIAIDLVMRRTGDACAVLGEGPISFGLIHAELHHSRNVVYKDGQAHAIDFDDCAFGHWGYDIAVACHPLRRSPNYPNLRAALLRGYTQHRALPPKIDQVLDTLIDARHAALTLWMAANLDNPQFAPWISSAFQMYSMNLTRA